jgi:hypothetical protein
MNPTTRLVIVLSAAGAASLAGALAWFWFKLRRRKDPAELERVRRLDVNRKGRISAGRILDVVESPAGASTSRLVVYQYEVRGVTYEAAQDVTLLPDIATVAAHLPGQIVSVKYDPKHPMNSIIACENWSGIIEPSGDRVIGPLKNKSALAQ